MKKLMKSVAAAGCAAAFLSLTACEKKPAARDATAAKADDHGHSHGEGGHSHAETKPAASKDGHGETIQMGEKKAGPYTVKVSRDGDIKPGGDVPVDIWVDGGAKGKAVRFWFGTEDGKGSIKAKCEVEVDQWHTHGEVPDPMPEGSKLWIEIEGEDGTKTVVGFDI